MGEKILIVDDDIFFVDLLRDILEAEDYEVLQAGNAADGLELLRQERPDLVTLDVMMPEKDGLLDGYGFLEEVRANKDWQGLPVVMVTALSEDGDIRRAHDLGATDYLPKQQMSPRSLVRIVRENLRSRSAVS